MQCESALLQAVLLKILFIYLLGCVGSSLHPTGSFFAVRGLSSCRMGLVALWHVRFYFCDWGSSQCPLRCKADSHHWTTREVQSNLNNNLYAATYRATAVSWALGWVFQRHHLVKRNQALTMCQAPFHVLGIRQQKKNADDKSSPSLSQEMVREGLMKM